MQSIGFTEIVFDHIVFVAVMTKITDTVSLVADESVIPDGNPLNASAEKEPVPDVALSQVLGELRVV